MTGPRAGVTGWPICQVAAALRTVAFSRPATVVRPGPAYGHWASLGVLRGASEAAQPPAPRIGVLRHCQVPLFCWCPEMCSPGETLMPRAHTRLLGGWEGSRSWGPGHGIPGRAQQVGRGEMIVGMARMLANEVESPAWFLVRRRGPQGLGK